MLNKKEFREMRRETMKGENNPRWNGGNSEYPNHAEFKRARLEVLKKSKGKCEICGKLAYLVHHIDGDKSNHSIDNLVALCFDCHEPLHRNSDGVSVKGKPTKYGLKYGMSLKSIAKMFRVCPATIYYWLGIPEKRKWLEQKLKENK
ncbi:hypothetical protein ES708_32099 [subsurface metagenome]